jgi:hypothetical protein
MIEEIKNQLEKSANLVDYKELIDCKSCVLPEKKVYKISSNNTV